MQRGHAFGVYIVDADNFLPWWAWAAFSETGKAVSEFSERRGQASLAPVAQACTGGPCGGGGGVHVAVEPSNGLVTGVEPSRSDHTVLEAPLLTLALRYRPKPKALPGHAVSVCLCVCLRFVYGWPRTQRSSQSRPPQSNRDTCGQMDGAMAATGRSALLQLC